MGWTRSFTQINQDDVVVLRPQEWSGKPGSRIEIAVETHGIDGQGAAGSVNWSGGMQEGTVTVPSGTIALTLGEPGIVTVTADWRDDGGAVIATNAVEIVCLPQIEAAGNLRVVDDAALAAALRGLGYQVSEGAEGASGELLVARTYTEALMTMVQQGARLLLITDAAAAHAPGANGLPNIYVAPREGTSWQGDWATSFAWVRKQGPLAALPGSPILEMEWAPIMPDSVMIAPQPWLIREHSWAGLAVGWVHKVASLLLELPYGRGKVVITTFKLNADTVASNAVAQTLFAGALELLEG